NRPVRKKRPSEEGDDEPPRKSKKKPPPPEEPKAKADDKPKDGPKKRKAKKKKSDPRILIGASIGGLIALTAMIAVLFYLLGKQPPAVALMGYIPNNAKYAYGINYAQMQEYVSFYKDLEPSLGDDSASRHQGFEPITTALGISFNELVDYLLGA